MGKANTEVPSGQERKIFIFSAYASKYHRTASYALAVCEDATVAHL